MVKYGSPISRPEYLAQRHSTPSDPSRNQDQHECHGESCRVYADFMAPPASPNFAAFTLSQTCCTARRALNAAPSCHATM